MSVTLSVLAPIVIVSVLSLKTVIPADPETKLIVPPCPTVNESSWPAIVSWEAKYAAISDAIEALVAENEPDIPAAVRLRIKVALLPNDPDIPAAVKLVPPIDPSSIWLLNVLPTYW